MKLAAISLRVALGTAALAVLLVGALPATANTTGTAVVISQVYGGGGNSGATYTNDFIELYNPTGSAVPLTGWSVQYASSTGTNWQKTDLSGSIPAGGYYLIREAQGAGGTTPLPTPNATGTVAMSASAGKVVLLDSNRLITAGTSCPLTGIDLVGYGVGTNCFEGIGPAPAPSNTTAVLRAAGGADADSNALDFTAGAPNPRSSAAVPSLTINDLSLKEGNAGTTSFSFSVSLSAPAGASGVRFDIATADGGAIAPGDYTATSLTGQTIPAGSSNYSFTVLVNGDTDIEANESFLVNVSNVAGADVTDAQGAGTILDDDADPCTTPYTHVFSIQGSGSTAAITGNVTTQGVVVGDYEDPSSLRGFYVQDASGDGDAATSDGIFVFDDNDDDVNPGDVVRVTGTASEFQDQTQVTASNFIGCGTGSVSRVDVTLPFAGATFPERYEGMLVRMPQTLYVTEHFQLGRFGQVVMSSGGRLQQPTNVVAPGAPAAALQAHNDLNRIIVDDELQSQNSDPIRFGRFGDPLSATNTLRGGDTATGIVGVMTYTWAGNAASGNAFRLRPVGALGGGVPTFQPANPRPASAPSVGGSVRVVGMNLLNFFNTFTGCTFGVGGPAADCRGANSATEFDRQWPKTVAAILAMNPDVLGVNELENDGYGPTSAIRFLVDKLNQATSPGTYAFVDADAGTGQANALGTDAIKVSMLYKPANVTPVGHTAVLNSAAFVNGGDTGARNRPSLAQAFQVNATGARFIVDTNHLKSKGSGCDDPDAGDGQGSCNEVRVKAATALVEWLSGDPTGTGDPDVLLMGDYNSYAMEDPITTIKNAGYTNLVSSFLGPEAYSYVFDGQWGYLDQALGSASIVRQVAGVGDYHINSDEPSVLDYNTDFKTANLIASLYTPDQFRVSDHDPVVVGLNPNAAPTVNAGGPYSVDEGSTVIVSATGNDPNGDTLSYAWDLDDNGSFETAGQAVTFSAIGLDGPSAHALKVQATDRGGLTGVSSATVNVVNAAPSATFAATPSSVFAGFSFTASLTSPNDPSPADVAAGFEYAFDCGSGYGAFGTSSTKTCPTSSTGTLHVGAKIRDKDGGVHEYIATVTVTVTYASLCSLTRTLVTKSDVADGLCDKLATAAAVAGNTKKRDGALNAYRNQLDAQAGKSVTAADAALLKSLSLQLQ